MGLRLSSYYDNPFAVKEDKNDDHDEYNEVDEKEEDVNAEHAEEHAEEVEEEDEKTKQIYVICRDDILYGYKSSQKSAYRFVKQCMKRILMERFDGQHRWRWVRKGDQRDIKYILKKQPYNDLMSYEKIETVLYVMECPYISSMINPDLNANE